MSRPPGEREQAPEPITTANIWDLHAQPGRIRDAAAAWRSYGAGARTAQSTVDVPAAALVGEKWAGDTSDSYHDHLHKLSADVAASADTAGDLAGALDQVAGALESAQGMLHDELGRVAMPWAVQNGQVTFWPAKLDDIKLVEAAVSGAHEIREHLDRNLLDAVGAIERARPALSAISAQWTPVADGTTAGWLAPREADGTHVIYDGDGVVISTGPGSDKVSVSIDPTTGMQVVTVNGVQYFFAPGTHLTVRTGDGDDTIEVAQGTRLDLTLLGGTGDDTITAGEGDDTILGLGGHDKITARGGNDRVSGGADRDYIDGGHGDDILTGGLGDDTVYGMDGNDRISGGDGKDYLEGAAGNDTIDGDRGDDMISGGRDDDLIRGGAGSDKVYTGAGTDTVDAGAGDDTVFAQNDDHVAGTEHRVTVELKDLGKYFHIEGSPEFVERVRADLDMLGSSPRGQMMLAAMDASHDATKAPAADWPVLGHAAYQGDTFTIKETHDLNGYATQNDSGIFGHTFTQHPVIQYNPQFDTLADGPPVTILYHEMAHVYDYEHHTLADGTYTGADNPNVPNKEREAAGLPIDDDHNQNTPDRIDPDHPYDYTENGLRDEMGAPHRQAY
jgi:uncharacterized protein YukE